MVAEFRGGRRDLSKRDKVLRARRRKLGQYGRDFGSV
jgi:hypothetical protein